MTDGRDVLIAVLLLFILIEASLIHLMSQLAAKMNAIVWELLKRRLDEIAGTTAETSETTTH